MQKSFPGGDSAGLGVVQRHPNHLPEELGFLKGRQTLREKKDLPVFQMGKTVSNPKLL